MKILGKIEEFIENTPLLFSNVLIFILAMPIIIIFNIGVTVGVVFIFMLAVILLNFLILDYQTGYVKGKSIFSSNSFLFYIMTFLFFLIVVSVFNSPIFRAQTYASLLKVTNIQANKILVTTGDKIRKVTEKMAIVKANKILGRRINQIELNTQYELGKGNIILFQGKQYWVFPLEYSGFFKWLNNDSIPGYILVDAINPDADAVFVNKKYKYGKSSYFLQNIERIALFHNFLFPVNVHFEIDNKGDPYWVASLYNYKIFGQVYGIDSIITINATNKKIKQYSLDKIPNWIDKIIPENLADTYINYYGKYKKGFWNYIFTGLNVATPTKYENKELWLVENNYDKNLKWFTGMTSVNKKDSSLSYAIYMDTKQFKAYKVNDIQGVSDESGAIEAINSHLGANALKWQAVLATPYLRNGEWWWNASIVDKKTNYYQKSALSEGKNPNNVIFIETNDINLNNAVLTPKQKIIQTVDKLEKQVKQINLSLKVLKESIKGLK